MPRGNCYESVTLQDLMNYFASPQTRIEVNKKWAHGCGLIKKEKVVFAKVTGSITDGVLVESFED